MNSSGSQKVVTNYGLMTAFLQRMIAAGIRAPSGDNCQPWWFEASAGNTLSIHVDLPQAESFFDFKHRGSLLSVGAVIENMRLQAAMEGFDCTLSYPGNTGETGPAAQVAFRPTSAKGSQATLQAAMWQRTVNRRPFLPARIMRSKLQALTENPVAGVRVRFFQRRSEIKQWARLIYAADRIRYSHPVIHEQVFSKILLSKNEALTKRVGLEIDRLGAGPIAKPLMRLIRPWDRMHRLRYIAADRLLARQAQMLALASGALCVVSIETNDNDAWIRAGEQVERLWIKAQSLGLCVHPITVALFLDMRYRETGTDGFRADHQKFLEEIRAGIDRLIPDGQCAMLFRLGVGPMMAHPAVRKSPETFLRQ